MIDLKSVVTYSYLVRISYNTLQINHQMNYSTNDELLYQAARDGNLVKVKDLLSKGTGTGFRNTVSYFIIMLIINVLLMMTMMIILILLFVAYLYIIYFISAYLYHIVTFFVIFIIILNISCIIIITSFLIYLMYQVILSVR